MLNFFPFIWIMHIRIVSSVLKWIPLQFCAKIDTQARPCSIEARPCHVHKCAQSWLRHGRATIVHGRATFEAMWVASEGTVVHDCGTWHGRASIEHGRALVSILAQNCNVIHFKTFETILTCIIQMKGKKFNTRTNLIFIENKQNT